MRSPASRVFSGAFIALGGLLAVLAILAVWIERQALDTDEWVETSSELLADERVQTALEGYLVEALFSNVDVQGEIEQRLPPQAQALAGPATGALREFAGDVAERALAAPAVQDAWATANRQAHELLLELVEGDRELPATSDGTVSLDLQALVGELAARLGISADVAERLPPDVGRLEIVRPDQLEVAQDAARLVRGLAIVLSLAAFGSLGLGIYLARGRRQLAVLWAGLALIGAGVAVLAIRAAAGDAVVDALVRTPSATGAAEATWSISTSLMTSIASTVIVFGALFVLSAWLGSSFATAAAVRRALAPALRDHAAWAFALLATAALIYFALAPTHGVRALLTLAALVALGAFGIVGLRRRTAAEFPQAQAGDTAASLRAWAAGLRTRSGARDRPAPGGNGAPMPASEENVRLGQLERLAELRAQGLLTEKEFEAEKARVLASSDGVA